MFLTYSIPVQLTVLAVIDSLLNKRRRQKIELKITKTILTYTENILRNLNSFATIKVMETVVLN